MRNTPFASRSRIECAPAAEAVRCRRPLDGVERAERAARFQRRGYNAVVDQLAFHDMGGGADRFLHRADLAAVELERDVVFCLRPDRRGIRQNRIRDRDDRVKRLVINDNGLGGIACAFGAFRHHEGDGFADIANDVACQRVIRRDDQRRRPRDTCYRTRQRADIVGGQFNPREHGGNAGHLTRRVGADGDNSGMRMGRANDDAMQRVWRREIGDVAPAAPQESLVFQAVEAAPQ